MRLCISVPKFSQWHVLMFMVLVDMTFCDLVFVIMCMYHAVCLTPTQGLIGSGRPQKIPHLLALQNVLNGEALLVAFANQSSHCHLCVVLGIIQVMEFSPTTVCLEVNWEFFRSYFKINHQLLEINVYIYILLVS